MSFEITFLKQPVIFSKYRLKSCKGDCSPYGLLLEGSYDGSSYATIYYKNPSLCFSQRCSKYIERELIAKRERFYIFFKMAQTGGECYGRDYYFGLTAIDFYVFDAFRVLTKFYRRSNKNIFFII